MDFLKDRRTLLVVLGGVLALAAGLGIAAALRWSGKAAPSAPPASSGGLVIEAAEAEDGKMDPAHPLRCFVAGKLVGELTLARCAELNGVATGALDVGVDATGALAAAQGSQAMLTPLPPAEAPGLSVQAELEAARGSPRVADGAMAACWRHEEGQWRRLPADLTLSECVQALFAGACEPRYSPDYGRWAQQTLRRVQGRVEMSPDNVGFRVIAEQGPGCSLDLID
jgi:hypothetical protein